MVPNRMVSFAILNSCGYFALWICYVKNIYYKYFTHNKSNHNRLKKKPGFEGALSLLMDKKSTIS